MRKKVFSILFTVFLLAVGIFTVAQNLKAATFVPCDEWDALCGLDCDLDGGVCGHWIDDSPAVNCPAGQIQHPTAGTCIYANDSVCQSVYGAAYYDGNPIDGCACNNGAIYNSASGLCEYPVNCPDGQKEHPTAGTCIYANDAVCQSVYGAAYYNGNEIDGCACNSGTIYNQASGLCEYPNICPDGMKEHPSSGNCIYASDAACRAVFGEAYYNGNEYDGCACLDGADYNSLTEQCEYYPECPDGQKMHEISGNCIYANDAMCRAHYGEAYYDGNEVDGCACVDGATWDGFSCILNLDFEIKVDPLQFTLSADGEASQGISAWLESSEGEKVPVPMWIKIQTPNNIRAGELDIFSGEESSPSTTISAVYTAPYIENTEKIEDNDVIEDLIYVFAEINGEKKYKVIEAILNTQATDFDVTLKFEKDGLLERTITTTFNEGALSGSVFFMDESDRFDPNGVKVTLDGTLPNAKQTKIHLETFTQNGTFFFENLGEIGETILDPIELTMNQDEYSFYDKYYKNKDKFVARVGKYGADTSFLNPYTTIVEDYAENLAEASYEDAGDIVDSLEMAAYTAYFFEFYGRKADESLDNFVNYMSNILVDTIGLVQGMVNVTTAVFDSAADAGTSQAKVVNNWLAKKDNISKLREMGQKGLRVILNTLRKGLSYTDQESQRVMNAFQDLIGGLESYLFADGLNTLMDWGPNQIKEYFANYMKRGYVADMATAAKKYSINLEKIPNNLDANIEKAENLFIKNTEDHNYRNSLQYEWDVDTAALTEFINVAKPAAKVALSVYLANPATASKIVDNANHAFNALKVAASGNHTYEWYALYKKDFEYLEKSLSILNTGKELAYVDILEISIKRSIQENKFELIKTVNAEVPEIHLSDILYNIAIAIEAGDDQALADNLDRLDEVRTANAAAHQDNIDYINEYSSYLNESNNEKAVDTLVANSDLDFAADLVDLRIINLAADPSEENIASFLAFVEELAKAEAELAQANLAVYDMVANLDKEDLSNSKNTEETAMLMSDIYAILSFLSLLVGSILSFIVFKKKGKKAGFIAIGITVLIVFIFLVLTGIAYDGEVIA